MNRYRSAVHWPIVLKFATLVHYGWAVAFKATSSHIRDGWRVTALNCGLSGLAQIW